MLILHVFYIIYEVLSIHTYVYTYGRHIRVRNRMFTPIKNLITYIQKNASGNSIFSGNNTIEESSKMETENIKAELVNVAKKEDEDVCGRNKDASSNVNNSETGIASFSTMTAENTENLSEVEEDDIEAQIESSIMLKTPVKDTATNSSEIIELKKSSYTNGNIVISHDFNRNKALSPIDDELEDFRDDPMEVIGATSSPCSNQPVDDLCSVESVEEILEKDFKTSEDFRTEDEVEEIDDCKTDDEQKAILDSDVEVEEKKDMIIHGDEDAEDPFLDLDHFKNRNVIVLDEVDLNASTASVDTTNTSDDPLAIACEEQEAFASDKTAALEELNLLNTSQTSQDEDTRTTTVEDLQWLKAETENTDPSGSRKIEDVTSEVTPDKEERNGEGSDSGLGSETSALHTTTTSIIDTSHLSTPTAPSAQTHTHIDTKDIETTSSTNVLNVAKSPQRDHPKLYRSNLKRRLEVDNETVSSLNSLTCRASSLNDHSTEKKPKRSINFDNVEVYYFPRQQGFGCVPSTGGCTLGMGNRHIAFKTLTLAEHAAELRRAHRMQLQEINPRGSSSEDSEESEEDYLSEGSGSDLDGESNGFLQPVSPKQRRALLKTAGIRKIDPSEKAECRNIRNSREICGCTCRDFCDPETCACSHAGIKCQVDRDMFPCGCSRDACGNTIGRVEFNPTRVRTHYIHTLMRLEMENRQQQNPYTATVASAMQPTPSSYYQTHLQPQSNYSSGYASPAYNTASEIHQQSSAASSYYHTHPNPATSNILYGPQTALEMAHNSNTNSTSATTSHYSIDSLDSSLFGASSAANTSYGGELMPVPSYHYGNMQTQTSAYNTYHNAPYINHNNTSNTYRSCAVPSIPPFGTATTTEATGVYHSVNSLTSLETTTAPSCSATTLENDASTSFISLSTPLASSSRLSQINDLLQHNRNATTALVAVSQNIESIENKTSLSATCLTQLNDHNSLNLQSNTTCSAPENVHKSCISFEEIEPPLKPELQVNLNDDYDGIGLVKPTTPSHSTAPATEVLIKNVEESPALQLNSEFASQTSLHESIRSNTIAAVSANLEPTTIGVAAGN